MTLAHPLVEHGNLPVSPVAVAGAGAMVVVAVAAAWPRRAVRAPEETGQPSWSAALSGPRLVMRSLAVVALIALMVAGRTGAPEELDNLVPPLAIAFAWPTLIVAAAVIPSLWAWIDPWDSIARAFPGPEDPGAPRSAAPAAAAALVWTWFLGAYPDPLSPRAVGTAATAYTIAMLAGCLALGRGSWLGSTEVFGLFFSWMRLVGTRALRSWQPPPAAELTLGVMCGGLIFAAFRRSELWGDLNVRAGATWLATLALLFCAAAAAAALRAAARRERASERGTAAAAAVPVVATLALALAMASNRLFIAVQLVPNALNDPLGYGWDLFGWTQLAVEVDPLGDAGLELAQVAVLLAGAVWAAAVIGARIAPDRRLPHALIVAGLFAAATVSLIA